jgi:glycosyltransferase involved in cell wall biosynthesis
MRARRIGVAERVIWHGFVPDAPAKLGAYDVFALSSRTEGSPMVLLEAAAAGVPIVAANVGGVPDLLMPDEARLVPPGNAKALAAAIRGVYENHSIEVARARAARSRIAESHPVAAWIDHYDAVYRTAIDRAAMQ